MKHCDLLIMQNFMGPPNLYSLKMLHSIISVTCSKNLRIDLAIASILSGGSSQPKRFGSFSMFEKSEKPIFQEKPKAAKGSQVKPNHVSYNPH